MPLAIRPLRVPCRFKLPSSQTIHAEKQLRVFPLTDEENVFDLGI